LANFKDSSHGFSNGMVLGGRVAFPLFGRGDNGGHWRAPEDLPARKRHYFMGIMDTGGDNTMLVPYTFSNADVVVLGSLGYKINCAL
jgi:hypothetical protein